MTSPGHHLLLPGQNPDGKYVMAVLLKRTYRIVPFGPCERAAEDRPIRAGDKHYGDPLNTTVEFEADFIPYKLATDVVLNGSAYAPGNRPTRELTAVLEVAGARKQVRVIGDRTCKHQSGGDPLFGDPRPFTRMPLRYERAYGGIDVYSDPMCPFPYPRNPLGKGFVVGSTKAAIEAAELPNLEDPENLLTPARLCVGRIDNWPRQPIPTGFGWYSRYCPPRSDWAGILPADKPVEQMLRTECAKLLPPDLAAPYLKHSLPVVDFRFFNGATPGLTLPYLVGDEVIRLTNLTPDGTQTFLLPGDKPAITLDLGDGAKSEQVVLHTVQIRADEGEVDLVWRAAFLYPGPDWLPEMKKAAVVVSG